MKHTKMTFKMGRKEYYFVKDHMEANLNIFLFPCAAWSDNQELLVAIVTKWILQRRGNTKLINGHGRNAPICSLSWWLFSSTGEANCSGLLFSSSSLSKLLLLLFHSLSSIFTVLVDGFWNRALICITDDLLFFYYH